MAKFIPIPIIATIRGKIGHGGWAGALRDGVQYLIKLGKRNFRRHPRTNEEHKTQLRFQQASLDYNQLDHSSVEYNMYFSDYLLQLNNKKHFPKFRGYFISRRMAELKASGPLAADPSKNKQDWSLKHRK